MHTPNLADENFKKLAALFPNAVTETMGDDGKVVRAIDADVLRQEISATVVEGSHERYQFTWPDKKKSVVLANQPIAKTLRLDRAKSVGRDGTLGNIDTDNIYIEGDNLDALKLLQETYLGKIKMIYIDPPYNTGNDFIYNDEFKVDGYDWSQMSGDYDDNGNRMVPNPNSNGRFHTDWLNMIYPRLKIAKDLLSDDGVIFISIDDNEVENLKKICGELYGEKNFVAIINWKGRGGRQDSKYYAAVHEYILVYAKKIAYFMAGEEVKSGDVYPKYDEIRKRYYKIQLLRKWGSNSKRDDRPNLFYPIVAPDGSDVYPMLNNEAYSAQNYKNFGCWRHSASTMKKNIDDGRVEFIKQPNGNWVAYEKIFAPLEGEEKTKKYTTWIDETNDGANAINNLFSTAVFDYPKMPALISRFLKMSHSENEDIILDFFSGSATTAHAVMKLNAEDGGHRKFILVQLPEVCATNSEAYKAGYKTICDIGEERIRRAGRKILDECNVGVTPPPHLHRDAQRSLELSNATRPSPASSKGLTSSTPNPSDAVDPDTTLYRRSRQLDSAHADSINSGHPHQPNPSNDLDIGFRVFRVDSSNMRDVYYNPREFKQGELQLQIDNVKPDRTHEDLLVQVMLDMGILLSSKIETSTIDGKRVFSVADGYLIACFDDALTDDTVKAIAQKKPYYAVFRDSSMASDSVLTNFEQIFATYSPKTVRKVI